MESTNRFVFGRTRGKTQSCSPSVIDPRLLSLASGSPQAERPFSAALLATGAVGKREPKQSNFQKHLQDETEVPSRTSQHTKLDSLQPSMATNVVPYTSIDCTAPAVFYPSATKTDASTHNDFDAAFLELETVSDTEIVDANAISYLSLWVAKNNSIRPPVKQLKALETLTEVPASILLAWLTRHGRALLAEQKPALNRAKMPSVPEGLYFVRCLKSGFRYRPRKGDSDEPKVFECTNQCGQLFCRKGDWGRHERLNFEEWPCPQCAKVLSRCEHLRAHFKDAHAGKKNIPRFQKRDFLMARQRPCGFCGSTQTNWSAWLAHVASHFEESREGRGRTMSYWTEYRFFNEVEVGTAVTAPEEALPDTMMALGFQSDHVTSSALRREAEILDEQNKKDEKSARQNKDDGSNGDFHGQIGNHYNDNETHFAIGPKTSTKVQTSNSIRHAPYFSYAKYSPNFEIAIEIAGSHNPERQASLYEGLSFSRSRFLSSVQDERYSNADSNNAILPASDILGHRDISDEECENIIGHRSSALSKYRRSERSPMCLSSSPPSRQPTPPSLAGQAKRGVKPESIYDQLAGMYGGLSIRGTGPEPAKPNRHRDQSELPRHKANEREHHQNEKDPPRPDNRQRNKRER